MTSFDRLEKEVKLLLTADKIIGGKDVYVNSLCCKAMEQVNEVKTGIQDLRTLLQRQKEQIETCKKYMHRLQHVQNVMIHIENNLPEKYFYEEPTEITEEKGQEEVNSYDNHNDNNEWRSLSPNTPGYRVRSAKYRAQVSRPQITYLTLEEYENVPKYMKGRLSYETVNKFIDSFNTVLQKKYDLFSRPRNTLRGKQIIMYDSYKQQETKETIEKGIYFCVEQDFKNFGNVMDKTSYNILCILRNTQRMREIRTTGIVRFCVLN